MKKAYLLLCDGFEEVEALTAADIVKRAGVDVKLVAVYKEDIVRGTHDMKVVSDISFDSAESFDAKKFMDADAVILPGGMPGTANLKKSKAVLEMVKAYNTKGKTVAAVCAAPTVLAAAGLLEGREATCFPGFEADMAGAKIVSEAAVISGNIVTGKSMGCAVDFGLAIVESMFGIDEAEAVEKSIYRK